MRTLIIFLLISTACYALELEPRITYQMYQDSGLSADKSFEVRLKHKGLFLYASHDNTDNRFCGQEAGKLNIFGIGGGMEARFDNVNLWLCIGYYSPQSDLEYKTVSKKDQFWGNYEALSRELNRRLGDTKVWDCYTYQIDPAVGGVIGVDITKRYKNIDIGLTASYKHLKFNECIIGRYDPPHPTNWAEHFMERDYSSYNFGGLINVKF